MSALHRRTGSYCEHGRTISVSSGNDPDIADVSFVFSADELAYDYDYLGSYVRPGARR